MAYLFIVLTFFMEPIFLYQLYELADLIRFSFSTSVLEIEYLGNLRMHENAVTSFPAPEPETKVLGNPAKPFEPDILGALC